MLTIQYLEPGPEVASISPLAARERLRAAFARLPIDIVLLGWDLPPEVEQAVAEETARGGARLYRWQPVLSGNSLQMPPVEWRSIGVAGEPVPGFLGKPEFTFLCPNQPAVQEAVFEGLQQVSRQGLYQGLFLDRMRFPSPAADPGRWSACFCPHCQRLAAAEGIDLQVVRLAIRSLAQTAQGKRRLVRSLLSPQTGEGEEEEEGLGVLSDFMLFRYRSISRLVQELSVEARALGLGVGLDCFSPALAPMVGQDLSTLGSSGDWVKIMSYGHTLGPAGLPYELLALGEWLASPAGIDEAGALACLRGATGLALPSSFQHLRRPGLSSSALAAEVRRARSLGVRTLLAGMELVELEGVTCLESAQIQADLAAFQEAGADGLALSWDLWHISLERLELVGRMWGKRRDF